VLTATTNAAFGGVDEGIAAMNRGDFKAAYSEFLPLAERGDDKAMVTIGLFFLDGTGVAQDYVKAYDWYLKAFERRNGDAYNNIGVLFRDGLGVKSPQIAYALFLIVHMRGLGSDDTQVRAGSNLDRLVQAMPREQILEALCLTEEYVYAFVRAKGRLEGEPGDLRPSRRRPALRDKDWWLDHELRGLPVCPPPQ
jgi:TPR repeat protein